MHISFHFLFMSSDIVNIASFPFSNITSKLNLFQVLYHVLGVVPAYQASVGPALNELCLGLQADDVANVFLVTMYCEQNFRFERVVFHILFCLQALYGVYSKDVHVRLACLNAVKCIPAVSKCSLPQNVKIATNIWIALHDPEKVNLLNLM